MPAYKDKNTNTWYFKCYYTDYEGNRRQKLRRGFERRKDAEKAEREFLETKSFQPDMPFSAFIELYKDDMSAQLKATSKETRDYQIENRILPFFSDTPICDIDAKAIRSWHNNLITEGLSEQYIKGLHATLSAIFNHAKKFYGLSANPCKIVGSPKVPNEQPKTMNFWTLDEFNKVIENVEDLTAKTAIMVLYWSGMRKGELFGLTWSKINFETSEITIDQNHARLHGRSVITTTKTGNPRTIKMPNFVMKQLKEYRSKIYKPKQSDFVFPWEKRLIEKGMSQGRKAAGVKHIRVHDLRHSHASLLISLGENIVLVSKRLGHANVSMTLDTYAHFFPDDENKMISKIEDLVSY